MKGKDVLPYGEALREEKLLLIELCTWLHCHYRLSDALHVEESYHASLQSLQERSKSRTVFETMLNSPPRRGITYAYRLSSIHIIAYATADEYNCRG